LLAQTEICKIISQW